MRQLENRKARCLVPSQTGRISKLHNAGGHARFSESKSMIQISFIMEGLCYAHQNYARKADTMHDYQVCPIFT
jgi:hypothetical protein